MLVDDKRRNNFLHQNIKKSAWLNAFGYIPGEKLLIYCAIFMVTTAFTNILFWIAIKFYVNEEVAIQIVEL